ncbi:MAG: hypothetical protein KGJ55_09380 [Gammaproteobacteria bacterium]|nr:hypothetical protein [Gammaproteobacteria bacterium]
MNTPKMFFYAVAVSTLMATGAAQAGQDSQSASTLSGPECFVATVLENKDTCRSPLQRRVSSQYRQSASGRTGVDSFIATVLEGKDTWRAASHPQTAANGPDAARSTVADTTDFVARLRAR